MNLLFIPYTQTVSTSLHRCFSNVLERARVLFRPAPTELSHVSRAAFGAPLLLASPSRLGLTFSPFISSISDLAINNHRIFPIPRQKLHAMATPDVARTQALTGLSLMSFASLCFQGVWQMAYSEPDVLKAPEAPASTVHGSTLEDSQFQALFLRIEALSTTIAQVNSSLHSKIVSEIQSSTEKGSSWNQRQQQQVTLSPIETAYLSSIVFVALWGVGFAIFHDNASKFSKGYNKGFLPRIILLTLLAANFGLVAALVFGASMRWYVHVLCIVWAVQVSLGWKVVTLRATIDEARKAEKD
jgi:hypothetical protein